MYNIYHLHNYNPNLVHLKRSSPKTAHPFLEFGSTGIWIHAFGVQVPQRINSACGFCDINMTFICHETRLLRTASDSPIDALRPPLPPHTHTERPAWLSVNPFKWVDQRQTHKFFGGPGYQWVNKRGYKIWVHYALVINTFPSQRLLHSPLPSHISQFALHCRGNKFGPGDSDCLQWMGDQDYGWVARGGGHGVGAWQGSIWRSGRFCRTCNKRLYILYATLGHGHASLVRPCGLYLSWSCASAYAPGIEASKRRTRAPPRESFRTWGPDLQTAGSALCAFLTFIDCNHKSNVLYNEIC